jgi:hypothetical protein
LNLLPKQAAAAFFVKDPRTTDSWLGLLVSLDQDVKLGTTIKIPNLFVGLAEYSAISME